MIRKFIAISLFLVVPVCAQTSYEIVPTASEVSFSAYHLRDHSVDGVFKNVSGSLDWNDLAPERSKIIGFVKAASIDTGNKIRDAHLQSSAFLDAANHPDLIFQSKSVRKTPEGYVADGVLAIRGVTKNISIPFQKSGDELRADFSINRHDFGVSYYRMLIKPEVRIHLKIKLRNKNRKENS